MESDLMSWDRSRASSPSNMDRMSWKSTSEGGDPEEASMCSEASTVGSLQAYFNNLSVFDLGHMDQDTRSVAGSLDKCFVPLNINPNGLTIAQIFGDTVIEGRPKSISAPSSPESKRRKCSRQYAGKSIDWETVRACALHELSLNKTALRLFDEEGKAAASTSSHGLERMDFQQENTSPMLSCPGAPRKRNPYKKRTHTEEAYY